MITLLYSFWNQYSLCWVSFHVLPFFGVGVAHMSFIEAFTMYEFGFDCYFQLVLNSIRHTCTYWELDLPF